MFAILRVGAFRARNRAVVSCTTPVTVLKPVCGLEPRLYESLRSFCDQDYARYQVVFGIRDASDPAIEIVKRLISEFPEQDLALVVDGRVAGPNLKVSNLINMAQAAKYGVMVIADSDMRVDRNYLTAVVAPFQDPTVGAVTCLYKGSPVEGLPSVLGAMFINDWFAPSVLVAVCLQQLRYCFGATMAVRKDVLEAIGGFAVLAHQLADDHMLGKMISAKEYRVALSPYIVENIVWEPSFKSLLLHELRWARTIRASRPLGHAFLFLTTPVALSLLFLLLTPARTLGFALVAVSSLLRVLLHYKVRAVCQIAGPAKPWLAPVRDVLCFAIWAASFLGCGVRWRGQDYSVQSDGHLTMKGERNL